MHLILSLIQATYWYDDALQSGLKSFGVPKLTRAQSFVIADIVRGERRASIIAKHLGVSRQAISQILIDLARRGLIQMADDPQSRSARVVELTPEFQKKGELCLRLYAEIEGELGRRIGRDALANLKSALDADWGEPPNVGEKNVAQRKRKTAKSVSSRKGAPAVSGTARRTSGSVTSSDSSAPSAKIKTARRKRSKGSPSLPVPAE